MTDRANIVLGEGANAVTIYCTEVEEIYTKKFTAVTPPQSTANWAAGPKSTKIVDLLRIEVRLNVQNAYIDSVDKSKLKALINAGGVFQVAWDGDTYYANPEKVSIKIGGKGGEQDEIPVSMTMLVGVNL